MDGGGEAKLSRAHEEAPAELVAASVQGATPHQLVVDPGVTHPHAVDVATAGAAYAPW